MSFLGFGRPQPSSAEKIAAVEAEMKLMADMMNRYAVKPGPHTLTFVPPSPPLCLISHG